MKLTDNELINKRISDATEMCDGLFLFLAQGHYVVEVVKFAGTDLVNDLQYHWDQYEVTLRKTKQEPAYNLTELSNFTGEIAQNYEIVTVDYFTSSIEAQHQLNAYLIQYSLIG